MDSPNCQRTACGTSITSGPYYRIWNQGHNIPRCYCVRCANRILEANRQMVNAGLSTITLKYERIESCSVSPA